jgi:hypothetical protein
VIAPTPATPAVETEAAFVARCTSETIAANPDSKTWAAGNCQQRWTNVAASSTLADAVLAAAPVSAGASDVTSLAGKLPMVTWASKPESPSIASGMLDKIEVKVQSKPAQIGFLWAAVGEPIPYDLDEALRGRGVTLAMIGCQAFGAGEATRVYAVNAPGKAPFGLSIYAREAPTADANSTYSAAVDLSGALPTLATLGSPADGWTAACSS